MDLHRCIGAKRFPVIIALIVVLLIANVWESVMIELQYKMRMMGSLEKLMELLIFDRFKAAVIVLLSAVRGAAPRGGRLLLRQQYAPCRVL